MLEHTHTQIRKRMGTWIRIRIRIGNLGGMPVSSHKVDRQTGNRKSGRSNYKRRGEPQKCFDIKNEIKQNPRPQQHALQLHFRFSDSHTHTHTHRNKRTYAYPKSERQISNRKKHKNQIQTQAMRMEAKCMGFAEEEEVPANEIV